MINLKKNIDFEYYANLISQGEVVAFPTETVYGLGSKLTDFTAVQKLKELKKREEQKPITLHISHLACIEPYVESFSSDFFKLYEHFMPGPITVILKKNSLLPSWISSDGIGIRIPNHPIAKKFIDSCGGVIAATSANLSNFSPLIDVEEVKKTFDGKIAGIIDGDKGTLASTVIDLTKEPFVIYREGIIKKEQIEAVLCKKIIFSI
jgi:L-threonylcarbamoyladenylate synthase